MRENAIRENVQRKYIQILHCDGKTNVADIFTKEDKDREHFLKMRDCIVCDPLLDTKDRDLTHFSMDGGVLTDNLLTTQPISNSRNP